MVKFLLIVFIPVILFCFWCCLKMASMTDKDMIEDLKKSKK